ncbi:MAG TPA: hypothetical protein VEO01_41210, partial [Pseudonocardiaceae bacterium]|nr:hypothetical protein [Pseudonocardiaceae bacterium]
DDRVMLCSPIILYDHPVIAPESPADLYDSTEIDEILTLRTMVLTDDEKAEARATDPRAAALIDRVDTMSPEMMNKLHGAIRYLRPAAPLPDPDVPWWDPGADSSVSPESDEVVVSGVPVKRGAPYGCGRGRDGPTPRTSCSPTGSPWWRPWSTTWTATCT